MRLKSNYGDKAPVKSLAASVRLLHNYFIDKDGCIKYINPIVIVG